MRRTTLSIATINPATGETVKTFEELSSAEIEAAWPPRPTPSPASG